MGSCMSSNKKGTKSQVPEASAPIKEPQVKGPPPAQEVVLPHTETPLKVSEVQREHEPVEAGAEQITNEPVHVVHEELQKQEQPIAVEEIIIVQAGENEVVNEIQLENAAEVEQSYFDDDNVEEYRAFTALKTVDIRIFRSSVIAKPVEEQQAERILTEEAPEAVQQQDDAVKVEEEIKEVGQLEQSEVIPPIDVPKEEEKLEEADKIEAPIQKSDAEIIGDQIYALFQTILETKDQHKIEIEYQINEHHFIINCTQGDIKISLELKLNCLKYFNIVQKVQ